MENIKCEVLELGLIGCKQFAALNLVKPESVRTRLCKTGSYHGVVPQRLASGRLAFPAIRVTR